MHHEYSDLYDSACFRRGVLQGDFILPKLFNLALLNISENLNWQKKKVNIARWRVLKPFVIWQHIERLRWVDTYYMCTETVAFTRNITR